GTWQRFLELKKHLRERQERLFLDEEVINPSRRHMPQDDPENNPDHDLAERSFLSRLWRCPWSDSTDGGSWRWALLDLLRSDWTGQPMSCQERVDSWRGGGWLQLETDPEGPWVLVHPGS